MESCQNNKWSKLNVVKMKRGDKYSKLIVTKMKSSHNGKRSKWKVVKIKSGQNDSGQHEKGSKLIVVTSGHNEKWSQ